MGQTGFEMLYYREIPTSQGFTIPVGRAKDIAICILRPEEKVARMEGDLARLKQIIASTKQRQKLLL